MSGSLFSPNWYRVADLKPHLRRNSELHRHVYRERVWYVLQDRINGQFHRFTPEAYELIGRMDGRRTLQQIWEEACSTLGDRMPTQQDVIDLVSQLYQANAIQADKQADISELHGRRGREKRQRLLQKLMSPFGLKLPLWDPDRFLERTKAVVMPVFTRTGFIIWLATFMVGLVLAIVHAQAFFQNVADRVLALENVLMMVLIYPVVKVIHELGHAYAVKRWGGEVREIGLMFLIFYPVPYTDASDATTFRDKRQRMIVGLAGIMVELFLASIAMIAWVMLEPGVVRAVAANVVLLAGVSTPLFNGNPLLRFDAYYVLADYIEVPNLAKRSTSQIAFLIKRYFLRMRTVVSPSWSRKEALWLGSYAVLSFAYRLFILLAVSLAITSHYAVLGGLIACWAVYMTIVGPLIRALRSVQADGAMRPARKRIYTLAAGTVATMMVLLFVVPLPYSTRVQGVVWVEDQAIIRAGDGGFLKAIEAQPGSQVGIGAPLLTLDNPLAMARLEALRAQYDSANQQVLATLDRPEETLVQQSSLEALEKEQAIAVARAESLRPRSAVSGEFLLPGNSDAIGKYYRRGERIGFIANPQHMLIVLLVPEEDIVPVQSPDTEVSIRFVTNSGRSVIGQIVRITPAPTNSLPSAILSTEGGGPFAPDPRANDPLQAFNKFYRVDVRVPDIGRHRVEERVFGRFVHDWEPIGYRWSRSLRRMLLAQLGAS